MNVTRIDHVGIAVRSLDASVPLFERLLGIKCEGIEDIRDQCVRAASFVLGESRIELLESTDPAGPIASFLSQKGEGIHHIALAADDADRALSDAKERGFRVIDRVARKGAGGMKVGFLNPRSTNGILVEFCSSKSPDTASA